MKLAVFDAGAGAEIGVVRGDTIVATGIVGSDVDGMVFSIDQSNARATVVNAPASTTGWVGNASCWIVRKGGSC